jgi:hypothetical protein
VPRESSNYGSLAPAIPSMATLSIIRTTPIRGMPSSIACFNDVKRDQRINEIANAGNQSDDASEPEAKPAGKNERVIEPSRHRLNIGDSWID